MEKDGEYKLSCWFSLSYASWLTLTRVLMEQMPDEWQLKMAELLYEYEAVYCNQPDLGTRVQITKNGKLIKTPKEYLNYRYPDFQWIDNQKLTTEGGENEKK